MNNLILAKQLEALPITSYIEQMFWSKSDVDFCQMVYSWKNDTVIWELDIHFMFGVEQYFPYTLYVTGTSTGETIHDVIDDIVRDLHRELTEIFEDTDSFNNMVLEIAFNNPEMDIRDILEYLDVVIKGLVDVIAWFEDYENYDKFEKYIKRHSYCDLPPMTICFGEKIDWDDREDAIEEFEKLVEKEETVEKREHYSDVLRQIRHGNIVCHDTEICVPRHRYATNFIENLNLRAYVKDDDFPGIFVEATLPDGDIVDVAYIEAYSDGKFRVSTYADKYNDEPTNIETTNIEVLKNLKKENKK